MARTDVGSWKHIRRGRAIMVGKFVVRTHYTIRQTAKALGMSRAVVHEDLHRLAKIDGVLYANVVKILEYHKAVRHIRGGEGNKRRWQKIKRARKIQEGWKRQNVR